MKKVLVGFFASASWLAYLSFISTVRLFRHPRRMPLQSFRLALPTRMLQSGMAALTIPHSIPQTNSPSQVPDLQRRRRMTHRLLEDMPQRYFDQHGIVSVFLEDCLPGLLIRTRSWARPLELTSQFMTDLPLATIFELLNEIGRGDEKAVIRLYRHYHGFLFAFIRHQLSNDADAEEVAQDVLMVMCKKPQAFRGQAKFSTWLCGIAKFKVIDLRRKQGGGLPMAEVDDELIQEQADPNWNFVAQMEAEEDEEALRLCRDALPDEQKEAIFWVFYQGEGLETVAQRQACPVGTVKSRLFNARRRLHDCMTRWMQGGRHA